MTYNRKLLDIIFRDVIQDQRETWRVRAEGGQHIPPTAYLDCRQILKALWETSDPKFCALNREVDKVCQEALISFHLG